MEPYGGDTVVARHAPAVEYYDTEHEIGGGLTALRLAAELGDGGGVIPGLVGGDGALEVGASRPRDAGGEHDARDRSDQTYGQSPCPHTSPPGLAGP